MYDYSAGASSFFALSGQVGGFGEDGLQVAEAFFHAEGGQSEGLDFVHIHVILVSSHKYRLFRPQSRRICLRKCLGQRLSVPISAVGASDDANPAGEALKKAQTMPIL